MPRNGIMEEIRSLLDEAKSGAEVIALGYNPSTVYKVQGQLRRHIATNMHEVPLKEQVVEWRERFLAERQARNEAESLAAQHRVEAGRLKEENRLLRQKVASLPNYLAQEVWKLVQPLKKELEVLRSVYSEINSSPGSPPRRRPTGVFQERSREIRPQLPINGS